MGAALNPGLIAKSISFNYLQCNSKMKNYKSYFTIPATREEVYAAITNPLTIQLWTGGEVKMSTEPGSEFSM